MGAKCPTSYCHGRLCRKDICSALKDAPIAHFVESPMSNETLDAMLLDAAKRETPESLRWMVLACKDRDCIDHLKAIGVEVLEAVNIHHHSDLGRVYFVHVKVNDELRKRLQEKMKGSKRPCANSGGGGRDQPAKKPRV